MTATPAPNPRDLPADAAHAETIWSRGGAWVFAQFPLSGAALLAAMVGPKLPERIRGGARWLGAGLLGAGSLLAVAGLGGLGRQLTPLPKPSPSATLVQSGAYSMVRHPVYGGLIVAVLGWSLLHGRWAGLLASMLLAAFFDQKASREERWLSAQFSEYPAYRRRVRKLIPWL